MASCQQSLLWPFSATLFNREGGEISMLDLLLPLPPPPLLFLKEVDLLFLFFFISPLSPYLVI
jgi:hypothetical protein